MRKWDSMAIWAWVSPDKIGFECHFLISTPGPNQITDQRSQVTGNINSLRRWWSGESRWGGECCLMVPWVEGRSDCHRICGHAAVMKCSDSRLISLFFSNTQMFLSWILSSVPTPDRAVPLFHWSFWLWRSSVKGDILKFLCWSVGQKPKDINFTIMWHKEKQQKLTIENREKVNFWHSFLLKTINYQNSCRLLFCRSIHWLIIAVLVPNPKLFISL